MNISRRHAISAMAGFGLASCAKQPEPEPKRTSKVLKREFRKTKDGQTVDLYTFTNAGGAEVSIVNYGGIVVSLKVPDRAGAVGDVVLGFDTFDPYLTPPPYFGA